MGLYDFSYLKRNGKYLTRNNKILYTYARGLYSIEEIDALIAEGYIPVATATELDGLRHSPQRLMGSGTRWEGLYFTGSDKKYVQVNNCNFNPAANNFTRILDWSGIYDGNSLHINGVRINFTATQEGGQCIFAGNTGTIRNVNLEIRNGEGFLEPLQGTITQTNNGIIENCDVTGYVRGNQKSALFIASSGGICAHNETGQIINCTFNGEVIGSDNNMGGIAGLNDSLIQDCNVKNATVNNTGDIRTGGIVGVNFGNVINSHFDGTVLGFRQTGGVIGTNNGGFVSLCSADGYFESRSNLNFPQCGGLVGVNFNGGIVEKSHSSGQIVYNGTNGISIQGGIVGGNSATGAPNIVRDCYSSCSVTSLTNEVGGGIGFNGSIVERCYSTGAVSGNLDTGGLIGVNTGTVTNSYYDTQTSNQSDTGKGEPRTTLQLQQGTQDSFILPAGGTDLNTLAANAVYTGWSTAIWRFDPKNKYPRLK